MHQSIRQPMDNGLALLNYDWTNLDMIYFDSTNVCVEHANCAHNSRSCVNICTGHCKKETFLCEFRYLKRVIEVFGDDIHLDWMLMPEHNLRWAETESIKVVTRKSQVVRIYPRISFLPHLSQTLQMPWFGLLSWSEAPNTAKMGWKHDLVLIRIEALILPHMMSWLEVL